MSRSTRNNIVWPRSFRLLVYPSAFDLSTSTLASAAGLTALVTTLGAARRAGPGTMRGARDPARPCHPRHHPREQSHMNRRHERTPEPWLPS
jgi:hypothetical protein